MLAFPGSRSDAVADCPQQKAEHGTCPRLTVPNKRSRLEKRLGFDPKAQAVSTVGEHAFVAPVAGDQRGPCPGLNALANHGYLPHNGVASIPTFIEAVDKGRSIISWKPKNNTPLLTLLQCMVWGKTLELFWLCTEQPSTAVLCLRPLASLLVDLPPPVRASWAVGDSERPPEA